METSNLNLPEIKNIDGIDTLFVHNKPFIALGGEIHNSNASNIRYMEENLWPNLNGLNLNTVLIPVYWECIEENEGIYDFSLVDNIIKNARLNNMHLIFLWFGLWKNAESMYIPKWRFKKVFQS